MKRVTGIGGVFFRSDDKNGQMNWYKKHLGIESDEYGFAFLWKEPDNPGKTGYTVWSPFKSDTEYFGSKDQQFMVNYRVADMESLIKALKKEGVEVVGEIEEHENGKFAWINDPDGNRIELWEPVDSDLDPYL